MTKWSKRLTLANLKMTYSNINSCKQLIFATANKNKVRELKKLLDGKIDVIPSPISLNVDEYGSTCAANSVIKARAYYLELKARELLPENTFIVADDSGIFVPALGNNVPGVFSARFSLCDLNSGKLTLSTRAATNNIDELNNYKLLELLDPLPSIAREAYFYAGLSLLDDRGEFINLFEGLTFGKVSYEFSTEYGWGYDHIFEAYINSNKEKTHHWGKVVDNVKNEESHRYKASLGLVEFVRNL